MNNLDSSYKSIFCNLSIILFFMLFNFSGFSQVPEEYVEKCDSRQEYVTYDAHEFVMWQNENVPVDPNFCMSVKKNGDFYTKWDNIENSLTRKSKIPGNRYNSIDYKVSDYSFTGNTFYGAYGWIRANKSEDYQKLIEFYIVEYYEDHNPKDRLEKQNFTVWSNDATYDVYMGKISGQPSLDGKNDDFIQIKFIRRENKHRNQGTITCSKFFSAMDDMNMNITEIEEVAFKIEGYGSTSKGAAYISATIGLDDVGASTGGSSSSSGSGALSGTHKIKGVNTVHYVTNNLIHWSAVKGHKNKGWSSQKWSFEHISGNEYRLRANYIKEGSQNLYLNGNNIDNSVTVGPLPGKDTNGNTIVWDSQIWILENLSGDIYRIKCKWGNKYLAIVDNKAYDWRGLRLKNNGANWDTRKWHIQGVAGAKVAPVSSIKSKPESVITVAKQKQITVYPNPTQGLLSLNLGSIGNDLNVAVYIVDMRGRVLKEFQASTMVSEIDVIDLPTGTYLMRIDTGDAITIKRFNRT